VKNPTHSSDSCLLVGMGSFGAEAPQDDAGWRVFSAVILSETCLPAGRRRIPSTAVIADCC